MNYLKNLLRRKEKDYLGNILEELQKLSSESIQVRKNQKDIDEKIAEIRTKIVKWIEEN